MSRPRLLDLFCGAGGCAVGYHRAGFDVVGVDNRPQPRYPFAFVQADALEYLAAHGREFGAIHASPPCQMFSLATFNRPDLSRRHQDLVTPTLTLLRQTGRSWVVENVQRAPLGPAAAILCGLMFGLTLFRHRRFEASFLLLSPPHPTHAGKRIGVNGFVCVAGHGDASWRYRGRPAHLDDGMCRKAAWSRAMGIDWMTRVELAQAIPPAYTEFVGRQLVDVIGEGRGEP